MKYLFNVFLIVFCMLLAGSAYAANIYADNHLVSACSDSTYSIDSRNCSGSDGKGYPTIQAAMNAMTATNYISTDDIVIREGTYNEQVTIPNYICGTSSDWITVSSHTGEWAIIDASTINPNTYAIGTEWYKDQPSNRAANTHKYWKFERLEITGGGTGQGGDGGYAGLLFPQGPFWVRFCYIHDNITIGDGNNLGGIQSAIPEDSIIEYNYFKDNGATGGQTHAAIGINFYSDYSYCCQQCPGSYSASCTLVSENNAMKRNTVRYNLMEDTIGISETGIHDKAWQLLTPRDTIDWTYETWGNDIHHNIITGVSRAYGCQIDFAQIHHNITVDTRTTQSYGSGIGISDPGSGRPVMGAVVYNNTAIQGSISNNYANDNGSGNIWPTPLVYMYNNIIDYPGTYYQGNGAITLGDGYMYNPHTFTASRVTTQRNYIYRPRDANHIRVELEMTGTMATYDSTYGTTNYSKASSEGSDNLYGSTYITRGAHVVSGSTTIANGGIGTAHPYLTGVTLPSYIGATNPNDNAWVAGVQGMNVAYFTTAVNGSTPSWIEGAVTPPSAQGCTISGGTFK